MKLLIPTLICILSSASAIIRKCDPNEFTTIKTTENGGMYSKLEIISSKITQKTYAKKQFNDYDLSGRRIDKNKFMTEVEILSLFVGMSGICQVICYDDAEMFLVTEFYDGGYVDGVWRGIQGSVEDVGRELLKGLIAMKENGVVHLDLDSSNILSNGTKPVIIDFGEAILLSNLTAETHIPRSSIGTAPEIFNYTRDGNTIPPGHIFEKCDIYSVGRTLYNYHIQTKYPERDDLLMPLENKLIEDDKRFVIPSFEVNDEKEILFMDMVRGMMKVEISERYDLNQICSHQFFNGDCGIGKDQHGNLTLSQEKVGQKEGEENGAKRLQKGLYLMFWILGYTALNN